ncbi:hypothetical protein FNH08_30455 [Streptomyces spongiae]|uniref:SPW repeat-containing integral membrane domain-containing protein n=2 Tax=Streptomyces spongiae TaxID=565072 RepID=A0A5N8XPN8_9ACTN|nr:hypothetical protein [Streptomyces spongiae]
METHPDILEMRSRHEKAERATSTVAGQAIEALALLTGVYLAISPWVAGFISFPTLTVNNLIVGIAYALLMSGGFGRAWERTHSMAWAGCALGVWTIIAPWAISADVDTTKTVVNNVIVGAIAVVLAIAASAIAAMGARGEHGERGERGRRGERGQRAASREGDRNAPYQGDRNAPYEGGSGS